MSIALSQISIANYVQTLSAVSGFLTKGREYFKQADIDPDQFVETRLHNDMLPFRFQIVSVAHHSLGTLEGLKKGVATPPGDKGPLGYQGLQDLVAEALTGVQEQSAAEIDALEGKPVVFQLGDLKLPFTAENFVLSFSLPNFYFHATTAYDLLRMKGVPLGKRNFLGSMRMAT